MKKHLSRIITVLLTLSLILGVALTTAFAEETVTSFDESFDDGAYTVGEGGGRLNFFSASYPEDDDAGDKYLKLTPKGDGTDRSAMKSDYADIKTGDLAFSYALPSSVPDYVVVDLDVRTDSTFPANAFFFLSSRSADNKGTTAYQIDIAKSGEDYVIQKGSNVLGTLNSDPTEWTHVTLVYDMDPTAVTASDLYVFVNGVRTGKAENMCNSACYTFEGFRIGVIDKTAGTDISVCFDDIKVRYVNPDGQYTGGDLGATLQNNLNLDSWIGWGYASNGDAENPGGETPDPDPDSPPIPATPLFSVNGTDYHTVDELTSFINGSSDAVITLKGNVEVPGGTWISVKKNITLDLAGYTVKQTTGSGAMFHLTAAGASLTLKNGNVIRGDASLSVDSQQCINTNEVAYSVKCENVNFTTNAMFAQLKAGDGATSYAEFTDCTFNILRTKPVMTLAPKSGRSASLTVNNCTLNGTVGTVFITTNDITDSIPSIVINGGTYKMKTLINMSSSHEDALAVVKSGTLVNATTGEEAAPFVGVGSNITIEDGVKLSTVPTLADIKLGSGGSSYIENEGADAEAYPFTVGEKVLDLFYNLTLYADLNLNLLVPTDAGITKVDGKDVAALTTWTVGGKDYYVYTVESIAAANACDTVDVTVSTAYSDHTVEVSILEYAKTVLATDTEECRAAEQLIVDLLAYIRASYAFFAPTDSESLAAIGAALEGKTPSTYAATEEDSSTVTDMDGVYDYVESACLDLSAATPGFSFYAVPLMDDTEISISVNGKTVSTGTYSYGEFINIELRAYDMRSVITVTVNDGGDIYTGTYSLYTYLKAVENGEVADATDGKLLELVKALYAYSVTAAKNHIAKLFIKNQESWRTCFIAGAPALFACVKCMHFVRDICFASDMRYARLKQQRRIEYHCDHRVAKQLGAISLLRSKNITPGCEAYH